jgi:hypothetical protein
LNANSTTNNIGGTTTTNYIKGGTTTITSGTLNANSTTNNIGGTTTTITSGTLNANSATLNLGNENNTSIVNVHQNTNALSSDSLGYTQYVNDNASYTPWSLVPGSTTWTTRNTDRFFYITDISAPGSQVSLINISCEFWMTSTETSSQINELGAILTVANSTTEVPATATVRRHITHTSVMNRTNIPAAPGLYAYLNCNIIPRSTNPNLAKIKNITGVYTNTNSTPVALSLFALIDQDFSTAVPYFRFSYTLTKLG